MCSLYMHVHVRKECVSKVYMFICMNVESINVCASMHKCVYMVCAGKVIES